MARKMLDEEISDGLNPQGYVPESGIVADGDEDRVYVRIGKELEKRAARKISLHLNRRQQRYAKAAAHRAVNGFAAIGPKETRRSHFMPVDHPCRRARFIAVAEAILRQQFFNRFRFTPLFKEGGCCDEDERQVAQRGLGGGGLLPDSQPQVEGVVCANVTPVGDQQFDG